MRFEQRICDTCGHHSDLTLTTTIGLAGWTTTDDNRDVCPTCTFVNNPPLPAPTFDQRLQDRLRHVSTLISELAGEVEALNVMADAITNTQNHEP